MQQADKASLDNPNLVVTPAALSALENCYNTMEQMKNDTGLLEQRILALKGHLNSDGYSFY